MKYFGVTSYENDPEGRPDGWPKTVRELESVESALRAGESLVSETELQAVNESLAGAMADWNATRLASVPYVITDLFDRFTSQERATIRAVARENDQVADLWDNLLALREGVECPPDGSTPGRLKSQAAKAACAAIFGAERADQLFARP